MLAAGFAMGGKVGWLTLVYAVTIGPIMHVTIPLFATPDPLPRRRRPPPFANRN